MQMQIINTFRSALARLAGGAEAGRERNTATILMSLCARNKVDVEAAVLRGSLAEQDKSRAASGDEKAIHECVARFGGGGKLLACAADYGDAR